MSDLPPDRLLELLDAVLDEDPGDVATVAGRAHASPFHFSRQLRGATGESPAALRRRITLERAAWQLQRGASVTDVAFEVGYASLEGFTRAFARAYGHPPSAMPGPSERGHWLPSPNGLHFHGPTVLYVDASGSHERPAGDVLELMVRHDVEDVAVLLDAAGGLDVDTLQRVRLPGHRVIAWEGPDESAMDLLRHLALSKKPWLAALEGGTAPDRAEGADLRTLTQRHEAISARWLAWVREVDRRGAWDDRIVDALCDPPESFLLGQVVAHVLTFSAHRRQLLRWMLRDAGLTLDEPQHDPDPIIWHRARGGDR